jgi:predicted RNase H-like nuclease
MAIVAGVDGCRGGWICITKDVSTGLLRSARYPDATALIAQQPRSAILAVDMPIGLVPGCWRACDLEARNLLGPKRRNSVFSAPIRSALDAKSQDEASEITQKTDGRRVSAQSFSIYRKVRDLDAVLSADVSFQSWVVEVHPEVCFWAWNGGKAMDHKKTRGPGRAERRRLVDAHYGPDAFDRVRSRYLVKDVGHDDINDAFAALWTAERILAGTARVIPSQPPVDSKGLRMEMWY